MQLYTKSYDRITIEDWKAEVKKRYPTAFYTHEAATHDIYSACVWIRSECVVVGMYNHREMTGSLHDKRKGIRNDDESSEDRAGES